MTAARRSRHRVWGWVYYDDAPISADIGGAGTGAPFHGHQVKLSVHVFQMSLVCYSGSNSPVTALTHTMLVIVILPLLRSGFNTMTVSCQDPYCAARARAVCNTSGLVAVAVRLECAHLRQEALGCVPTTRGHVLRETRIDLSTGRLRACGTQW